MINNSQNSIKHRFLYIPIALLFLLSFVDCAKKGRPTGGALDTIPPVIVKTNPENYSINFSESEISITFDEYIKLKDLQQNLLISPPMTYAPIITPLSTAKTLKIKILDTLRENTTYAINFGKSIVDNHEENAYDYYKYVFSTGNYIDSLKVSGTVDDIKFPKNTDPVTVMLYELTEDFKDSLIYTEKPTYITTTKDSTNRFELTNLKEGNYLLLALQETNNDYKFQPKTDKIGFFNDVIHLPTDSAFGLKIFKETPENKIGLAKHETKNHIVFDYQGETPSLDIDVISEVPEDFSYMTFKDSEKDSLHYWFKPALEVDSLLFKIKSQSKIDTVKVRVRDLFADSLKIKPVNPGNLKPRDTFFLRANTPLTVLDSEKIRLTDKDTLAVSFEAAIQKKTNSIALTFERTEEQTYSLLALPGAITDFYESTNDTLQYRMGTKLISDYGEIAIQLNNAKTFPIIVELVDAKFNPIDQVYLNKNKEVNFLYIDPGFYYIRIIYDTNENGVWDSGFFLTRTQPEKIVYYPSKIEVKPNWSLNETFILE